MSTAQPDSRNRRTGAAIRRRRQVLGWEQRELAEKVGVHVNSVQKWEAGTHFPGRKLGKLEEVLGIRLDEEPDPYPLVPKSLIREIMNTEGLTPEERQAVIRAVGETLATDRDGASGPSVKAPG